jgi:hypothetical protein
MAIWNQPEVDLVRARPTETAMFFYLYLLVQHELVKIVLLKVVELCEISNFALGSMI